MLFIVYLMMFHIFWQVIKEIGLCVAYSSYDICDKNATHFQSDFQQLIDMNYR
jgi:hypothetical protein